MDTESLISNRAHTKVKKTTASLSQETPASDGLKTKLLLSTSPEHPLSNFQNELKTRGIKNLDLNEFVVTALSQVPEAWWQARIEELTPLEYRVNNALSDPNLRQKLSELLNPAAN